jgi:hypothetical protein
VSLSEVPRGRTNGDLEIAGFDRPATVQHRPEGERPLIQLDADLPALAGLQGDLGKGLQFPYRPRHRALDVTYVDLDDLGTGYRTGVGHRDRHAHREIAGLN